MERDEQGVGGGIAVLVEKLERFIAMPEWPRFYMDKDDAARCVAALTRAGAKQ